MIRRFCIALSSMGLAFGVGLIALAQEQKPVEKPVVLEKPEFEALGFSVALKQRQRAMAEDIEIMGADPRRGRGGPLPTASGFGMVFLPRCAATALAGQDSNSPGRLP